MSEVPYEKDKDRCKLFWKIRVKWRTRKFVDYAGFTDYMVTDHEGEVIGTTKSLFGDTYLVVACTDNQIREVHIDKAITIE